MKSLKNLVIVAKHFEFIRKICFVSTSLPIKHRLTIYIVFPKLCIPQQHHRWRAIGQEYYEFYIWFPSCPLAPPRVLLQRATSLSTLHQGLFINLFC